MSNPEHVLHVSHHPDSGRPPCGQYVWHWPQNIELNEKAGFSMAVQVAFCEVSSASASGSVRSAPSHRSHLDSPVALPGNGVHEIRLHLPPPPPPSSSRDPRPWHRADSRASSEGARNILKRKPGHLRPWTSQHSI